MSSSTPPKSSHSRPSSNLSKALPLLCVLGSSCAYTLTVESFPQPALVELPDGSRVSTPTQARLRWAPFNSQTVRVQATGYRPVEIDLRDEHMRFGQLWKHPFRRTRGDVEFVLIPTHGAAGTWSETDVPD